MSSDQSCEDKLLGVDNDCSQARVAAWKQPRPLLSVDSFASEVSLDGR